MARHASAALLGLGAGQGAAGRGGLEGQDRLPAPARDGGARHQRLRARLLRQHQQEGLVIDVRRNNGGNIDSWIIEKLLRKRVGVLGRRTATSRTPNMQNTFRGHLVVLIDELTYSDGETFAAGVKALEAGRRWSASAPPAPACGSATATAWPTTAWRASPSSASSDRATAQWLIEGVGVTPDVEVDNLPHETFNGPRPPAGSGASRCWRRK